MMIGRIALATVGTLVGLAAAEVYLRSQYGPEAFIASTHGDEGFVEHPFLPYIGRPLGKRTIDVPAAHVRMVVENNSDGFRTREFPGKKDEDDFFIVCLGGSTTWGEGSESDKTAWPGLLEQMLGKRYPAKNVEVFSLGQPLADTAYNIVSLALLGLRIRPDLVIVYEGWNDLEPTIGWNYRSDDAHYYSDFDPDSVGVVQRFLPNWMLSSRTVALATFRLEDWFGNNHLKSYVVNWTMKWPDTRLSAQRTLDNLRTIHSIAQGHGAEVVFSTFQYFDPSFGTIPFVDASWSRSDTFRKFFDANGFSYVDQDLLIPDGDRTIQYDQGHFTAKGETMMAQNFFDYIVAHALVPD
jgi:lysophospholipase L1-like esterase